LFIVMVRYAVFASVSTWPENRLPEAFTGKLSFQFDFDCTKERIAHKTNSSLR